jgi:two-component system, OmpR family, phosphate regulon sensor histidine kinase PhoR
MKGRALKYIIILATISIAGILFIQFTFLRSSYNFTEKQFTESTTVALKEVTWQILQETGNTSKYDNLTPIEIFSNNTFIVNVDVIFDKDLLKKHLLDELKKHDLYVDFEFAIYDPETEQLEDATLVTSFQVESDSKFRFPVNENYTNYFVVHFPNRTSYFNARLSVWYFFTALLAIVVFFFGYTLWVIIKQRQLSEVQKNFINNLTHELKTPISSIGLAASVINDEKILESPQRLLNYARIIQEQNNRLSKNVEKVLNLASLEKNRIRLNPEKINIVEFLNETTTHFKQTDPGQKANISTNIEVNEVYFIADKFHFSNLIVNILENAVKYCDKEPTIVINLVKKRKNFELKFTDNGIGIPKEHRKKIFKKFYRVPTGNVHNVKGFGLGLDYVLKIVKAHGWKINVDENPKGGSIFTLTIHK